jgi:diguanylate cyclase (GGDEF)-like protein
MIQARLRGDAAVVVLAASMAAAVVAWWALLGSTWPTSPIVTGVPAVVVLLLVVAGELCTVDVYLRKETHSISLRTIPVIAGLFVLTPSTLLGVALVGVGGVLVVKARLAPIKLLFNLALVAVEVALALSVFHAVRGTAGVDDPRAWIAAMTAALVVDVACGFLVTCAMKVHDPDSSAAPEAWLAFAGAVGAVTNATVALVAVLLFSITPTAPLLLAGIAAALFAAYRAFVALRQRHSELEVLSEFTDVMSQSLTVDDVAIAALREAKLRLEAECAEIWLLGTDSDDRRIALDGDAPVHTDRAFHVPITSRLWGRLVSSRAALVLARTDRNPVHRELLDELDCDDLVAAALSGADGITGIMLLRDREGDVATFGATDARVLGAIARYTSIALEKGRLVDEVRAEAARREHDALHDQLTGLPNRRQFVEHATDALGTGSSPDAAVLLLDVDDFKEVNDTFGHNSGDEVLIDIAQRLAETFQDEGMVARLGGDEFAVLVHGINSTQAALRAAERLIDVFARPQHVNGVALYLQAAVGIALCPLHGTDAATLLRCADVAMYQAKSDRRSAVVYDPATDSHTPERVALAADLRRAIADETFELGFQPIQHLATGRILGVEVLARWEHPTRGLLPPPVYVEVAEQSDLIRLLTGYVLRRALEQRNAWSRAGLDLRVSVNVSVHDLHRDGFADEVLRLMDGTGTPGSRLVLELTETQALHHPERISPVLERLRVAGVVIAIDDFGTGYSSITSLRSLPVDEIKIDRSFVSNMLNSTHDHAIVGSLIDLANRLGIEIVAEGVEDDATRAALASLGCHCIQGYTLTPALGADALHQWIRSSESGTGSATVLRLRQA